MRHTLHTSHGSSHSINRNRSFITGSIGSARAIVLYTNRYKVEFFRMRMISIPGMSLVKGGHPDVPVLLRGMRANPEDR